MQRREIHPIQWIRHFSPHAMIDLCLVLDGPVVQGALVAGSKVVWTEERSDGTGVASLTGILDNKTVRKRRRVVVAVERCPLSVERLPLRDRSQIFPTLSAPVLTAYPLDASSALVCGIEEEQINALRRHVGQDAVIVPSVFLPREDGLWLQVGWSGATVTSVVDGKIVAARHLQTSDASSNLIALEREVGTDALRQALSKSLVGDDIVAPLVAGFCASLARGVALSYNNWSRDGRTGPREVRLSGSGATLVGLTNALGAEGFSIRHPSGRLGSLPLSESSKWQDVVAVAKVNASTSAFPAPVVERKDWSSSLKKAAVPAGVVVALCAVVLAPVVAGSVDAGSASNAEASAHAQLVRLQPEFTLYNQVVALKQMEPGLKAGEGHISSLMSTVANTLPPGASLVSSNWSNGGGAITAILSITIPDITPYHMVATWHSVLEGLKGVTSVTMGGFSTTAGQITTSATVTFDRGAR